MSKIDRASANAASSNILVIYAATMKAHGEQGKRLALILHDPGLTHNLITHDLPHAPKPSYFAVVKSARAPSQRKKIAGIH